MNTIKVSIFEDNRHLRESLQILLNGTPGFSCIGAYGDCRDLDFQLSRNVPDVVLMDIEMPEMNGIEALRIIRNKFPHIQVVMQTMFDDDHYVFQAICYGASGYILKSTPPAGYITAIEDVYRGGSPMSKEIARKVLQLFQQHISLPEQDDYQLTPKEKEVLAAMTRGLSFKMIADELQISYETVRTHVKKIYHKLHVNSNTEAVSKVLKEKLL